MIRFEARIRATGAIVAAGVLSIVLTAGPAASAATVRDRATIVALPHRGIALHHSILASGSGNLTYHNGKIMKTSKSYAIFWEPATLQSGASTYVSSTYNSLITRYFNDIGGSGLYNTATQYYQIVNAVTTNVQNVARFGGSWVDTSAYPATACGGISDPNCVTDAQLRAEIAKAIAANTWTVNGSSVFFVFTSYGENSCFSSTSRHCFSNYYCAYHSRFSSNGHKVIYANIPYAGTDLAGCGVPHTPNNDIDADSTLDSVTHEQIEAVTDPTYTATTGGWWDAAGNEIADKCSYTYGTLAFDGGLANQQLNGHFYLVQEEWSNAGSSCVQTYP